MRFDHTATVAAEVRAEMGRQGITQTALAKRLGWLQNRLSRRIATDGKHPLVSFTVGELIAVAAELHVPVMQFLPVPTTLDRETAA